MCLTFPPTWAALCGICAVAAKSQKKAFVLPGGTPEVIISNLKTGVKERTSMVPGFSTIKLGEFHHS